MGKMSEEGKTALRSRRLSAKSRLGKKPKIMFSDVTAVNLNGFTAEKVPDGVLR